MKAMSAQEIYNAWTIWLGVAGVIVVVAAALLITIGVLARQIADLAATALEIVEHVEQNTKPIWQINATNHVARQLLDGAQAIEGNATAIAGALHAAEQRRAA
jgi:sulfite exporter TauE/SafE